jgi:hypothetical protein
MHETLCITQQPGHALGPEEIRPLFEFALQKDLVVKKVRFLVVVISSCSRWRATWHLRGASRVLGIENTWATNQGGCAI